MHSSSVKKGHATEIFHNPILLTSITDDIYELAIKFSPDDPDQRLRYYRFILSIDKLNESRHIDKKESIEVVQ